MRKFCAFWHLDYICTNNKQMVKNLTNEAYHSITTHISKSGLDKIRKAPALYYEHCLNPKGSREGLKPKKHFLVGTIAHSVVLEPEKLAAEYLIEPVAAPKRPTAAQIKATSPSPAAIKSIDFWERFDQRAAGRKIIPREEYETAQRMREALMQHPAAAYLLEAGGVAEESIFFEEQTTKTKGRIRPDFRSTKFNWLIDYKTAQDASPEAFKKSVTQYRYHVQGAWYTDGAIASGLNVDGFAFIVQEKAPPYLVAVYYLGSEEYEIGRAEYLEDCETYQRCLQSGNWHGYPEIMLPLKLQQFKYNGRK